MVEYMKIQEIFKRIRNFIICCRKTVDEVGSVAESDLEDFEDLQWYDKPKENNPTVN